MAGLESDRDYYDIVLLGKTGMGKSSIGNKLLQVSEYTQSELKQFSSELVQLRHSEEKRFPVGGDEDQTRQMQAGLSVADGDAFPSPGESTSESTTNSESSSESGRSSFQSLCNPKNSTGNPETFSSEQKTRATMPSGGIASTAQEALPETGAVSMGRASTSHQQTNNLQLALEDKPGDEGRLVGSEQTPNVAPNSKDSYIDSEKRLTSNCCPADDNQQETKLEGGPAREGCPAMEQNNATSKVTEETNSVTEDMHEKSSSSSTTTKMCELISNESTKVRVLDVPGFSDTRNLYTNQSVSQRNLGILRWLVRIQIAMKLKVKCLLYFLPVRGVLEKADGALQEELRMLHHFFGDHVFNVMVVATTQYQDERHQDLGYDKTDFEITKKAFRKALLRVTHKSHSPPFVFIGTAHKGKFILDKIKDELPGGEVIPLKFQDSVCARCSSRIRSRKEVVIGSVTQKKASVPESSDDLEEGMCHPVFKTKKVAGRISILSTLKSMLHFIPDEYCVHCEKPPGSPGCCAVNKPVSVQWKGIHITVIPTHSCKFIEILLNDSS